MLAIAPSLLAANWLELGSSVCTIEQARADWMHIDVMDGHFVPNISLGPAIARAIIKSTATPSEVHLMVEQPELLLDEFLAAAPRAISIHAESSYHLHRLVQRIQAQGVQAGVALNPATPWEAISPLLPVIDYVLVMTVNPGFGGQPFIAEMLPKIAALRQHLQQIDRPLPIWVDGGVGLTNVADLKAAGASVLVTGSAFFNAPDPVDFVKRMKSV